VLPEILTGKKRICLAITEPSAGSDVKNIATTAEKTADGKYYIVNGEKKISCIVNMSETYLLTTFYWITNGMPADYFMVCL
jgi:alkylation response protein AidB-like acyl-CoA dehydrogenase